MKFSEFVNSNINEKNINEGNIKSEVEDFIVDLLDKEFGNWGDDCGFEISKDSKPEVEIFSLSNRAGSKVDKIIKSVKQKFGNRIKLIESEDNESLDDLEKELNELLKQSKKFLTNLRNAKTPEKRGKWRTELNQVSYSIDRVRDQIEKLKK